MLAEIRVLHTAMKKFLSFLLVLAGGSGCAVMHRSAIGEVLPGEGAQESRVELGVSELGVDRESLSKDVAAIAKNGGSGSLETAGNVIEFFTWATTQSPRTGNPTRTDTWADNLVMELKRHCPNGQVSGIQTLRESAEYPYVSGEIVRVRATCYRGE